MTVTVFAAVHRDVYKERYCIGVTQKWREVDLQRECNATKGSGWASRPARDRHYSPRQQHWRVDSLKAARVVAAGSAKQRCSSQQDA